MHSLDEIKHGFQSAKQIFGKCIRDISSVTTIRLSDNNSQVRYPIRHVRYFIHKQFQMPPLFIQKHFAIWQRLACQQTTALLKEFPGFFTDIKIACSAG